MSTTTPKTRRTASSLVPAVPASVVGAAGIAVVPALAETTRYDQAAFEPIVPSNFVILDTGNAFVLLANGTAVVLRHDQFSIDANGNLVVLDAIALTQIANATGDTAVADPYSYHAQQSVVQYDFQTSQFHPVTLGELDPATLRMQAAAPLIEGAAGVAAEAGAAASTGAGTGTATGTSAGASGAGTSAGASAGAGAGASAGAGAAAGAAGAAAAAIVPVAVVTVAEVTDSFAPPAETSQSTSPPTPSGPTSLSGFVIRGIAAYDYSGRSVSSAGDINGDGFGDVIIGAYFADPNGIDRAGESYIVFGTTSGNEVDLSLDTLDGSNGFVINGVSNNDRSGRSVASAGDFNNDGYDDAIVGAMYAGGSGAGYVVFGKSNADRQLDIDYNADRSPPLGDSLNLSTLDGTDGFAINGNGFMDLTGVSVSFAGDINNDGFDDIVVGAPRGDPPGSNNAGEINVIFGSDRGHSGSLNLSSIDGKNGFIINGVSQWQQAGFSVSSAGDINNDGYDDIIIGSKSGESYVVFGQSNEDRVIDPDYNADGDANEGDSLNLSSLAGGNGFKISSMSASDLAGQSVSSAGDINNDGFDDFLVGAHGANGNTGKTYVVFGMTDNNRASDPAYDPGDSSLNLGALDGGNGFVIDGIDANDSSGATVSSAGDVNNDGFDDILIGAPGGNNDASGESYVVFGKADGYAASFALSSLDGNNGFVINGNNPGDGIGGSISSAGDLNNDGYDDIIIGTTSADPNGVTDAGESYVIFGMETFNAVVELDALPGLA